MATQWIHHAGLGRSVEVPASTARALAQSGWVPVDPPTPPAPPEPPRRPRRSTDRGPVPTQAASESAGAEPDRTTDDSEEK